jgi:tRNA (guanine-N(7)-)-methyltransferase subunit TRM82
LNRLPSLFYFSFGIDGMLTPCPPIQLAGNILSVACLKDSTIIVSVDSFHDPSSTETARDTPASPQTLLQAFKLTVGSDRLDSEPALGSTIDSINSQGTSNVFELNEDESSRGKKAKALRNSLYAVENLRKREPKDE